MKAITRHAAAIATWQNACKSYKGAIAFCRTVAKQYREIAQGFAVIGEEDDAVLFHAKARIKEQEVTVYEDALREAQKHLKEAKKAQKKEGGAK